MSTLIAEIKNENGQVLGIVILTPKLYSTGSQGYFGQGKLTNTNGIAGAVQVQWVNVHSNPNAEKNENYDPNFFAVKSKAQQMKALETAIEDGEPEDGALAGVHPAFTKLVGKAINPVKPARKTTRKTGKKK